MVEPNYLSINNIPPHLYETFENKLKDCSPASHFVDIMKSSYVGEQKQFDWVTNNVDKLRNESWAKIFPEIYELIR